MLPGLCTYAVLSGLIWASLLQPLAVGMLVLLYDAYWLYHSTSLGIRVIAAYRRMRHAEATDWLAQASAMEQFGRVHHVVIVPTYGESVDILRATLQRLAGQDFPTQRMTVVLAFEARDPDAHRRAGLLQAEFGGLFGNLWVTFHPQLPGEIAGKSSNQAWAARFASERLAGEAEVDLAFSTITTCDADSRFHGSYFSALTCQFLSKPRRRLFQPVILFYSNIWRVPAPSRVLNSVHSLWQLAKLTRTDKLVTQSTYSMALSTCMEAGYWDGNVIPEDSHMFFKLLFKFGPEVQVEPIFLPVVSDAAESAGYVGTLRSQFEQEKRWAWGVADIPYVIRGLLRMPRPGRWKAVYRGLRYIEEHLSWPLSPFLITFGAGAPGYFSPGYARTSLGHLLPALSGYLLTASLASLVVMVVVDCKMKPAEANPHRLLGLRRMFEWVLMPAVGIGLSALPGLAAHTRLLLGRYLEYRVTPKLAEPETLPLLQMEQVPVHVSSGQ